LCSIISQDSLNIYFNVIVDERETYTYICKSNVLKVKYASGDVKIFSIFTDSVQVLSKRSRYFYSLNGELLNARGLGNVLLGNKEAYSMYQDARGVNTLSSILGFAGGFLIGLPLGSLAVGNEPNWLLGGIGVGLIAVAIPINKAANKRVKEAVDIYNSGLRNTSMIKPQLKLGITSNGIGLVMVF